ncbi:ABC transporter permease [Amycolatopsis sp. CA-230715]|uniref:ABC transporter permease n=1 Tax=Amycolatopsis sp. CA-230715 TaxID=2745196 RepID=UPI001C0377E2|nr:ABC transporter permease [Amycolatopsis sp. CA-230715]QWF83729.1 Daunorubicin/doxorubicin resistance ABC transporter permease protein DrrB [Amycolatopsis sp. CA-230715]
MTEIAWRGSGFGTQVRVLTGRSLRAAFADRSLFFFSLLQPVVLLLLFSQVFDGIGRLPEVARYGAYIDFLMPSTLVNIALTTAMSSGAALLTETYTGFVSRLRGMPISLMSVLLARTLADTARLAVQLAVTLLAGVALLGFSPGGGLLGTVTAVLLTLVVGWGLSWVFLAVATMARKPETLQTVSFIAVFPLMFSSTAYMPPDVLPAWVRALSTVNPLTYAIDAVRSLSLGFPVGGAVWLALALTAAAALAGAALAGRNFRRNSF